MTTQEFSNEFDVLYNNIMSNQAPGLNEYEKSVFLTKAQDEIIKNHFNANSNVIKEGFDMSAKRQIDFSSLLFTKKLSAVSEEGYPKIHPKSSLFRIDASILMIVNESIHLTDGKLLSIIPVTYLDLTNLLSKPYKFPPKYQAWRYINNIDSKNITGSTEYSDWKVISSSIKAIESGATVTEGEVSSSVSTVKDLYDNVIGKRREYITNVDSVAKTYELQVQTCEVISSYVGAGERIAEIITDRNATNASYIMRYVKRPNPIILVDLDNNYNGLSINGLSKISECELDESLHTEILQRAVELAKAAYLGDVNTIVELGKRSE